MSFETSFKVQLTNANFSLITWLSYEVVVPRESNCVTLSIVASSLPQRYLIFASCATFLCCLLLFTLYYSFIF